MLKVLAILALLLVVSLSAPAQVSLAQPPAREGPLPEESPLNLVPEPRVPESTLDPQTAQVPQTAPVPAPQGDASPVMSAQTAEALVMELEREIAVLEALLRAQAQLNADDLLLGRRLPFSLCLASPLKGDCHRLGTTFGEGEP